MHKTPLFLIVFGEFTACIQLYPPEDEHLWLETGRGK